MPAPSVTHSQPTTATRRLHAAAATNQPAVIELLAQRGADVNAKNKAGQTPLSLTLPRASRGRGPGFAGYPDCEALLRKLGATSRSYFCVVLRDLIRPRPQQQIAVLHHGHAVIAFGIDVAAERPVSRLILIIQPGAVFGPRGIVDSHKSLPTSCNPNVLPYCVHSPRNFPL